MQHSLTIVFEDLKSVDDLSKMAIAIDSENIGEHAEHYTLAQAIVVVAHNMHDLAEIQDGPAWWYVTHVDGELVKFDDGTPWVAAE